MSTTPPRRARNEPASLHDVRALRHSTILRGTSNPVLWAEGIALLGFHPWTLTAMLENRRIGAEGQAQLLAAMRAHASFSLQRSARMATMDDATFRAVWAMGPDWQMELCEHRDCPMDLIETALAAPDIKIGRCTRPLHEKLLLETRLTVARLVELLETTTDDARLSILLSHPRMPGVALREWMRRAASRGARWPNRPSRETLLMHWGELGADVRLTAWLVKGCWSHTLIRMVGHGQITGLHARLAIRRIARECARTTVREDPSDVAALWYAILDRHPEALQWRDLPPIWDTFARVNPHDAQQWLAAHGSRVSDERRAAFWMPLVTHADAAVRVSAMQVIGGGAPSVPKPASRGR
jgi:hypothetical protein